MVTRFKQKRVHSIKVEFADEAVTSWGGLVLGERLASGLGLWRVLKKSLPKREGCRW